MMPKWSLGVVLALAVSGAAMAGEARRGPHDGGVMAAHIAQELGLDDATRAKVEAILDGAEAKAKAILSDARVVGRDLKAEHDAERPDLKKMEKLIRQLADLRADVAVLRLHAEADVDALLTPDQRLKLRALRAERRDHDREGDLGHEGGDEGLE
jgi:Spy/CpxP family protein refolding chaperone